MAQKRKNTAAKKTKNKKSNNPTLIDRLPSTKKDRLKLILFFTERAMGKDENETLVRQANRLKEQIKNCKD